MNNNLYNVEKNLRSIAKRFKSIKYSLGMAILFLMLEVSAFSEEINSVQTREEITTSKNLLRGSVENLQIKLQKAKAENEEQLKGARLELIQLTEQGDQVVKSPWSSWQFGMNYMYEHWGAPYKGRGDKPNYEGIFTRSDDIFQRSIHRTSTHYSSLITGNDSTQASANLNGGDSSHFGTTDLQLAEEPIIEVEVSAGVKPRQPKKMEPLTVRINHNLNFRIPPLPDFEAPNEKVLVVKTFSGDATYTPVLGASILNSKNLTSRVITVPQANDKSIAPIQNVNISNGKIDITFDGKIKTVGANKAIDEENSTMNYKTHGVNFTSSIVNLLSSNITSDKFSYKNYSSIISYVMGHNDFSIDNAEITVGGTNYSNNRSAISIEGDDFSIGASAPNKITTLTIGENTKLLQKTDGSLIHFNMLNGKYGNLVNKGTIEVIGKKSAAINFSYPWKGLTSNNKIDQMNLHPVIKNAETGQIIGGGHLPTTEEDYLKIKRGEFEGDGGYKGLVHDVLVSYKKSGYHFIQDGTFELRGYQQYGFFSNNNGGARIFEFNKPLKLLGKKGYGMVFYNTPKNLYTEGTIVNKGSYELIATKGDGVANGYDVNNLKKSIFRIYMLGEDNTALYFVGGMNQDSYENFNIDNVDIVSENAKNNSLVRLERVSNFNLGGEGQYHSLLMKNEKGWRSQLITAHDSKDIKIHEKMEMGVFNSDNVTGITIQNSRRTDSNLTNRGKLVMTGNAHTKSVKNMTESDLTKVGKGMTGFLANNKATLTNHGDFLFYGGNYKGYAEYYGDDPDDSTKVKLFRTPFEKNSYGMNAKYGGKIISDGVTYIRVKDKKSVGLFSSKG